MAGVCRSSSENWRRRSKIKTTLKRGGKKKQKKTKQRKMLQ